MLFQCLLVIHNKNCISVSFRYWEVTFPRVYTSIWDTVYTYISSSSSEYSAQGQVFHLNSGTKAAVLLKDRLSTANSGTKAAVLLGMDRCGSFPLLSAPHFLFNIWTDIKNLKRSQGHQRGGEESGLANWVLRTLPIFTTGVKYQFNQGFIPDQRSGKPNHPSPPYVCICIYIFVT